MQEVEITFLVVNFSLVLVRNVLSGLAAVGLYYLALLAQELRGLRLRVEDIPDYLCELLVGLLELVLDLVDFYVQVA